MCVYPSLCPPLSPRSLPPSCVACGGRLLRMPKAHGILRVYTGTGNSGSPPSPSTHALTYRLLSSALVALVARIPVPPADSDSASRVRQVSPCRATSLARGAAAANLSRGTSGLQRASVDCAASPVFRFGLARVRLGTADVRYV
ncbi:hypothetical protein B0H16DRAFT_1900706 [Mycena metata]|uniref:Uncharacterized protein n=1 Tax=Mycena metata TaxID=1033252 RepID=A0AAD7H3R9_9AGAR|nr:hypothetical protein B0H16DRAFT_1900706 [Mycena metata]